MLGDVANDADHQVMSILTHLGQIVLTKGKRADTHTLVQGRPGALYFHFHFIFDSSSFIF